MHIEKGPFICPECGGTTPGIVELVETDPSVRSVWTDILERIVCAQCGFVVPAQLGERWNGISVDEARREWREVYRDGRRRRKTLLQI
ncbi:MAG: hypothetical protein A2283_12420 [Lentisphaerae bacterium RIFOXYA12_FULL_48_11]|nr:MAG: hypothetical protein A2283_12420 [Lentisphaerae bacterium RIFOXYA12_FULL_48_11]